MPQLSRIRRNIIYATILDIKDILLSLLWDEIMKDKYSDIGHITIKGGVEEDTIKDILQRIEIELIVFIIIFIILWN